MAYENTDVSVQRSQSDVISLLLTNGATGYNMVYRPPTVGIEFELPMKGSSYIVRISAAVQPAPMEVKRKVSRYSSKMVSLNPDARAKWTEQNQRRIWRVIYYHLKDVFECAASGVMDLRELLLPHLVDSSGRTLAETIMPQLANMGAARALPAKGESTQNA